MKQFKQPCQPTWTDWYAMQETRLVPVVLPTKKHLPVPMYVAEIASQDAVYEGLTEEDYVAKLVLRAQAVRHELAMLP